MVKYRTFVLWVILVCSSVSAGFAQVIDKSKYMTVDELRPGMKGFGRTVMSGTEIIAFNVEIVSVMHNAFYSQQDVILVRCSGANLEHSGIIAGMSGSPVYIPDADGKNPRMIGAIAYGWPLSKDPIGGVQPIQQMLAIPGVLESSETKPTTTSACGRTSRALGVRPDQSRFASMFQSGWGADWLGMERSSREDRDSDGMSRLTTPVMVSGMPSATMAMLREQFRGSGFEPIAAGSLAAGEFPKNVKLEPGSALCVPLMRGDSQMAAVGTCTEVIGDKVLGFGHSFNEEGRIEMPLATGGIHSVIPSISRSFKLGASLDIVGTLFGDESTGIAGRVGAAPRMIPVEVVVIRDGGEPRTFRFECLHHRLYTPMLLMTAVSDAVYSHSDLPREHTVRYSVDLEFAGLGRFHSGNVSSQEGARAVMMDTAMPVFSLLENQFGKSRLERVKVEVRIESAARLARMERAELVRDTVKPGQSLEVRVQWRPYQAEPIHEVYAMKIPENLPEGTYALSLGSSQLLAAALRSEKPHLFYPERSADILDAMNLIAKFQDDRVCLRMVVPGQGVSLGRNYQPDLPSYRRRIVADAKRTDVESAQGSLVADYPVPFTFLGSRSFTVRVDKRADQ